MKYVFVDTDNGTATPGTPVQTSSSWPANSDRFSTLGGALGNTTVRAETDDLTIYCRGATDDTVNAGFGAEHSAASITIEGDVSAPAWDASKYTMVYTGSNQVLLTFTKGVNATIQKLQASYTGANNVPYTIRFNNGGPANTVDGCIIRIGGSGTSTGYGIRGQGGGGTLSIKNTIVQVTGSPGGVRFGIDRNFCTMTVYNSVVEGFSMTGGVGINGAGTIKNCAIFNNTDDVATGTVSYSATDDEGTANNNINGLTWTNQFQDYVNGDFRLKSGSALIGAGIGPASDANVPTTDIAGVARSGTTTDIGAAMFVPPNTSTIAWLRI